MSDALEKYQRQRQAKPSLLKRVASLGRPGALEDRLLDRLAEMTRERLALLGGAQALSATRWEASALISFISVHMNVENTPGSWGADERFNYTLFPARRKPYEDKLFFSFGCAVRQAQLALLGEEAFLERHCDRVSAKIAETDQAIRQRRGLPEPAGLLALRERSELLGCAQPAGPSSASPKPPSRSL